MIDNEIDLKNYFHVIKIQKITKYVYQRKSARCCIFRYLNRFQYLSKSCYLNKEKSINFLFIAVIYFPLSIQMNILTLYYICICKCIHMLELDQEPSYNLPKKFLSLPRILKLIEDMVNDSTPLNTLWVSWFYETDCHLECTYS